MPARIADERRAAFIRRRSSPPAPSWAADVSVGAYSIIGPRVRLGVGTHRRPARRHRGQHDDRCAQPASSSSPRSAPCRRTSSTTAKTATLIIGDDNRIREFCTLQPGTEGGGMVTRVGNGNLLMNYSHIAHDCILGDRIVVANGVQLGGHVIIEDGVVLGALAGIHQFVRVGESAHRRRRVDGVAGRAAVLQRHRRPRHAARAQHPRPEAPRPLGRDRSRRSSAPTASCSSPSLRVGEAAARVRAECPAFPRSSASSPSSSGPSAACAGRRTGSRA